MLQLATGELFKRFVYEPDTGVILSRRTMTPVGHTKPNGYLSIAIRSKGKVVALSAHRVAWQMHYGHVPPKNIDHINRDKTDNRIGNLRLCDQTQNQGNYLMRSNNKSGVRGVYWSEHHQKWVAQITYKGKARRIGGFVHIDDAAKAYQAEYSRLFGEFVAVG